MSWDNKTGLMLKRSINIFSKNRIYVLLALFILAVNVVAVVGDRSSRPASKTPEVEAAADQAQAGVPKSMFDPEEIKAREEKLKALAGENPVLYVFIGLLNLTIFFFIFIGFMIDIYLAKRFFLKKPLDIRTNSPDAPRWPLSDVVRVVLLFLSFGYAVLIAQSFLAHKIHIFRNDNFKMIFDTVLMNLVGIGVIFHFIVNKYGHKLSDIGLTFKNPVKNAGYAVIGYIALVPVVIIIMVMTFFVVKWLNYQPPVQPIVRIFMEEKTTGILLLSTLFAAIFGPVAEEIFFRGFLYSSIKKIAGSFWGIMITSVIFSALHAHPVGFLPIMALGMLLAYMYEKTGSLVPCISIHIIHNVIMVVLVFLVKGLGA